MVSFRGTYWLSRAYFILLRVCRFFLFLSFFLLFSGVQYLLRYGGKFNNTFNKAVKFFLGSWVEFRGAGCFSNITGLVQFGKNLSFILSPFASYNYFLQSISVKLIYQFSYPNNSYLFFRFLERVFEEERNGNRKENSQGVTTSYWLQKKNRTVKDRNDKILGFDNVFIG